MKLCRENNGAAIYVGRGHDSALSFVLNIHTTVEYLNTNVSRLVSSSNTFLNLLSSVHCQGQKC